MNNIIAMENNEIVHDNDDELFKMSNLSLTLSVLSSDSDHLNSTNNDAVSTQMLDVDLSTQTDQPIKAHSYQDLETKCRLALFNHSSKDQRLERISQDFQALSPSINSDSQTNCGALNGIGNLYECNLFANYSPSNNGDSGADDTSKKIRHIQPFYPNHGVSDCSTFSCTPDIYGKEFEASGYHDFLQVGLRDRSRQNTTETVRVPSSEHVAEIVGRQGCKIKELRAKTNTYIKTPVRGHEPVFIVTGRKEDVRRAQKMIEEQASHFTEIRANRLSERAVGVCGEPIEAQHYLEVAVPYKYVGLVVGVRGTTIKRIQEISGAYIVTPNRDSQPVFEIRGTREAVVQAAQLIRDHIALKTQSDDIGVLVNHCPKENVPILMKYCSENNSIFQGKQQLHKSMTNELFPEDCEFNEINALFENRELNIGNGFSGNPQQIQKFLSKDSSMWNARDTPSSSLNYTQNLFPPINNGDSRLKDFKPLTSHFNVTITSDGNQLPSCANYYDKLTYQGDQNQVKPHNDSLFRFINIPRDTIDTTFGNITINSKNDNCTNLTNHTTPFTCFDLACTNSVIDTTGSHGQKNAASIRVEGRVRRSEAEECSAELWSDKRRPSPYSDDEQSVFSSPSSRFRSSTVGSSPHSTDDDVRFRRGSAGSGSPVVHNCSTSMQIEPSVLFTSNQDDSIAHGNIVKPVLYVAEQANQAAALVRAVDISRLPPDTLKILRDSGALLKPSSCNYLFQPSAASCMPIKAKLIKQTYPTEVGIDNGHKDAVEIMSEEMVKTVLTDDVVSAAEASTKAST